MTYLPPADEFGIVPADAPSLHEPQNGWRRYDPETMGRPLLALLILLPILGALAGLGLAAIAPTRYTAHAYVLVTATGGGADVSAVNIAQAVARVATKESVLGSSAAGDQRLRQATQRGELTASSSPDAPLVDLAATSSNASDAASLADAFASQVERHVTSFSPVTDIRAEVFAAASPPAGPSSPNKVVDLLAGLVLGILASAVIFVVQRA